MNKNRPVADKFVAAVNKLPNHTCSRRFVSRGLDSGWAMAIRVSSQQAMALVMTPKWLACPGICRIHPTIAMDFLRLPQFIVSPRFMLPKTSSLYA
jgi:hypothetical protein